MKILEDITNSSELIPRFRDKLRDSGIDMLHAQSIDALQINLGKLCNQSCRHCHVNAGPNRTEVMRRETLEKCLEIVTQYPVNVVDITGGSPEMNPNFRWFVEECHKLDKHIIVRCNLTVIFSDVSHLDLPDFFARNQVEVVASLPFFTSDKTDRMRGRGVFDDSIKALLLLNEKGYAKENSGLTLNLVYNPAGAFLPGSQANLEKQFKKELGEKYSIAFNNLFTITNMPISRFLEFLQSSGNHIPYMEDLACAFNEAALSGVMCLNMISVSWDGHIFDCDFNQMLDMKVSKDAWGHIDSFDWGKLVNREILVSQHCYGCTAGSGSSCGGAVIEIQK